MEWKVDKTSGYVYCIDKESPYANSQGKVYQHHYVMCKHIKRPLRENECVHHIDRDKSNNDLSNLMLLTNSEHAKLHAIEDRGYSTKAIHCPLCQKKLVVSTISEQVYCSNKCANLDNRKFEINKDDLHTLVWSMPTTEVAEILGVSDVAVAKRCKMLGIDKPPRGYWRKLETGKL